MWTGTRYVENISISPHPRDNVVRCHYFSFIVIFLTDVENKDKGT